MKLTLCFLTFMAAGLANAGVYDLSCANRLGNITIKNDSIRLGDTDKILYVSKTLSPLSPQTPAPEKADVSVEAVEQKTLIGLFSRRDKCGNDDDVTKYAVPVVLKKVKTGETIAQDTMICEIRFSAVPCN